jgi:hypothetical protein
MSDEVQPSRAVRVTLSVGTVLAVIAVIELFSFFGVSFVRRQWFTYGRLEQARAAVAAGKDPTVADGTIPFYLDPNYKEVIHPYLGYVLDKSYERCPPGYEGRDEAMELGFECSYFPFIEKRSPDKVIVAVLGGSVAAAFPAHGMAAMVAECASPALLQGRKLHFVPLALPGYKQPQQLMTLNYLLALGAEFDIVINLDGLNEVALPAAEAVPKGVFPFFPRWWQLRVPGADPDSRALAGELVYRSRARSASARAFSSVPWRYSTTAALIWTFLDRRAEATIAALQVTALERQSDQTTYAARGPSRRYTSEAAMYEDFAEVWKQSSLQLHRLCEANGIRYYHFLQPDQYVEGSKPMGPEEAARAFRPDHPYRKPVMMGYPYLIAKGKELARAGVRFFDLTQVFATTTAPVYGDDCCHFTPDGYAMLGRAMGRAILGERARRPGSAK